MGAGASNLLPESSVGLSAKKITGQLKRNNQLELRDTCLYRKDARVGAETARAEATAAAHVHT